LLAMMAAERLVARKPSRAGIDRRRRREVFAIDSFTIPQGAARTKCAPAASCNRQGLTCLRARQCLRNSRCKSLSEKYFWFLKGGLPASRYGSCYLPRIACRKRHVQRARQENRIGLFESRIGSTGPDAINRVNCWFRPHLRPCLTRPPHNAPSESARSSQRQRRASSPRPTPIPIVEMAETHCVSLQGARYPQFK
jgi:hypothetical protein